MEFKSFYQKHENKIVSFGLILFLLLFVGLRYDYYYDLNDDVVMKDLLAGVYTGTPEGHNIQMQYPLSLVISLLYRIFPTAPVYGIFLCLCQYGALWLMAGRSLRFRTGTVSKIAVMVVFGAVILSMILPRLIFVQYTFTSGMLTAAAAYWFITSKKNDVSAFIRANIPAVLLVVLAYMIRSEMALLLLPMVCVAGVYRWSMETQIWNRDSFTKYLTVIGAVLVGIVLTTIVHEVAFRGADWERYVAYFNSRTELYDFQGIPSYEGNEAVYEEVGLTKSEQYMLLEQYNFGLDDTLEAGQLDTLAEYQLETKADKQSFWALLTEKVKEYVYRMSHKEPEGSGIEDDYPWNIMIIFGYMTVLIMVIWSHGDGEPQSVKKIWIAVGMLAFLFCVRTALWMFLLMRGRTPVRITHSLYLMEFWILLAMLHIEGTQLRAKIANLVRATIVYPVIFGVTAAFSLPVAIKEADISYEYRTQANVVDAGMKEYCRNHPENFYFFDVYSTVSYPVEPYLGTPYSEKMFQNVDNTLGNYDIMGGWLVKSPSYDKKLEAFEMESMSSALLEKENVYMMAELAKGTEYFVEYYADQGVDVQVQLTDTICDIIGVYKIERHE